MYENEADHGSDDYELSPNYEALKDERAKVWQDYSQSRLQKPRRN